MGIRSTSISRTASDKLVRPRFNQIHVKQLTNFAEDKRKDLTMDQTEQDPYGHLYNELCHNSVRLKHQSSNQP